MENIGLGFQHVGMGRGVVLTKYEPVASYDESIYKRFCSHRVTLFVQIPLTKSGLWDVRVGFRGSCKYIPNMSSEETWA